MKKVLKYIYRKANPFVSGRVIFLPNKKLVHLFGGESRLAHPNLIIIGAGKAGTTSLHSYLNQHPDIFMSYPVKEINYYWDFKLAKEYFNNRKNGKIFPLDKNDLIKNYMLSGYDFQQYIGDTSPRYAKFINESEIFSRLIHQSVPNAKLIYILRNPFERLVSHYWQIHEGGYIPEMTEDQFVDFLVNKNKAIYEMSLYFEHLKHYLRYFEKSQIHICFYEDLKQDAKTLIKSIYRFLEINDAEKIIGLSKKLNVSRKEHAFSEDILYENLPPAIKERINDNIKGVSDFLDRDLFSFWNINKENATS